MLKRCEVCGSPFEAKRPSGKYCSPRCRQRAHRGGGDATVTALPGGGDSSGSLTRATRARLGLIGRLETELGVAALLLASRLDGLSPVDTGAGVAALMKEYRSTLAEAVKDAQREEDALDNIREAAALKLIRGA